jgi:hypothetical protein
MSVSGAAPDREAMAADFARRFAEFWRAPTPERLDTVLAEQVRLVAPMTPTTHTLAEGKEVFRSLFGLIPDLTGEVHSWGTTVDGLLIEFTLAGTVGGKRVSWRAVDHFVVGGDGFATERINYFDPLPLIAAIARRPRAWPALLRSRLRPRRSQSSRPT